MQVANVLAYFDTAIITAVKSFIVQAPGDNTDYYFLNLFWMQVDIIIPLALQIFSSITKFAIFSGPVL